MSDMPKDAPIVPDVSADVSTPVSPSTTPPKLSGFVNKHKKYLIISLIAILIVAVGLLAFYFYKQNISKVSNKSLTKVTATATPTPKPTPTPIPLRPDTGTQGTYAVSQGKHVGPTFRQIIFDPLDAKKGQTLTITVGIVNNTPVEEVTGTFQMDNSQVDVTFQKVSRDEATKIETWQTTINLADSVLYKYILSLSAKASNGVSKMGIAPRS